MSGLDSSILLFPIEMEVTMDGYIKKLKRPTADLSKNNKLSENGMFIILEPLDDATMEKFGFQRTGPETIEALPEAESEEEQVPEDAIQVSDPKKQTLNEFLNQKVMYQGKIGTLVTNLDGGFSVEIEEDGVLSLLDINVSGKNIKDGNVNIVSVGLSPIAQVETLGQVTQINSTTINARFLDKNERTAEINGIKYTINRDSAGAIVSLSYYTNDKEIDETQEKINKINKEISDLQKQKKEGANKNIEREIRKKTFELNRLNSLKTDLVNKNQKRTRRGGNADDLIFALNRLPNRFQKQVPASLPTDREDQVNLIAQLSESESVTKEIDKILSEHGTTKDIEDLFDGKIDNLTPTKQKEIEEWGVELIIKLEEYQNRLANEERSTVPVDNTIAAVNEILNNLTAIKFFKNGKITKTSRKEFEARTKVQQGTNVPSVQKPAGATTEGVSRQTISREDLEKSIQDARQRIQGISLGSTSTQPTEDSERDEIRAEVEDFFDESTDDLEMTFTNAVLKFVFGQTKEGPYSEIVDEVYNERLQNVENNAVLENLAEGEILLNSEPVGAFKKINQTFIVQSVDLEARTVQLFSPIRKKSYNFTEQEVKENFMRPSDETKPVEEMTVTPQTKENVKGTEANITNLSKDPDALEKIEVESENLTPEERMENVKNIFNKC
jgi:hypothetical protein